MSVRQEKRANCLGTLNPRNNEVVRSLHFLFVLHVPKLELEKLQYWKANRYREKKAPTKACSLKPKDQEKGSLTSQIIFRQ